MPAYFPARIYPRDQEKTKKLQRLITYILFIFRSHMQKFYIEVYVKYRANVDI